MPTALFISPHLDDAAFSVGGTAARLARRGWRVVIATVFTRSVLDPSGFALRCQTDKGLPASADYMQLRREEDDACARILCAETRHLNLPEAPHRGYDSAAALFSGVHSDDQAFTDDVERVLGEVVAELRPDLAFAPLGIGGHVDHRHVVRAVAALAEARALRVAWYRDLPYALRHPGALPDAAVPLGLSPHAVGIGEHIDTKLAACASYASQLGFQFARETPGADPEASLRAALTLDAVEQGRPFGLAHAETVGADAHAAAELAHAFDVREAQA